MDPVPAMVTIPCPRRCGAGQRRYGVGRDQQSVRAQHSRQDLALVLRSAAHAKARHREAHCIRIQAGFAAGFRHAPAHGALQFGAAFARGGVIAGTGSSPPQNAAAFVADQRRGCGLSAVYAQEEFHGIWYSRASLLCATSRMPHNSACCRRSRVSPSFSKDSR